jgi:hypothetical protein
LRFRKSQSGLRVEVFGERGQLNPEQDCDQDEGEADRAAVPFSGIAKPFFRYLVHAAQLAAFSAS